MAKGKGLGTGATPTITFRPDLPSRTGRVYANFASISHSPFDFTLRFCDILPPGDVKPLDGGVIMVPTVAEVVVPAALMGPLIEALQGNLERYEKAYGAANATGNSKPSEGASDS